MKTYNVIGQPARQDLVGRIKGASYELRRTPDTPGTSETHSEVGPSPNEDIILGRETEKVQLRQNCRKPLFLHASTSTLEHIDLKEYFKSMLEHDLNLILL